MTSIITPSQGFFDGVKGNENEECIFCMLVLQ